MELNPCIIIDFLNTGHSVDLDVKQNTYLINSVHDKEIQGNLKGC